MNKNLIIGLVRGAVYAGLFTAAHVLIASVTTSGVLQGTYSTVVLALLAAIDHAIPQIP